MPKKIEKKTVGGLDENGVRQAIVTELGKDMPRMDQLSRLIGRFNRLRGRRVHQAVLQLVGKAGADKVADAILGDNR